jgi:hypothetical protein
MANATGQYSIASGQSRTAGTDGCSTIILFGTKTPPSAGSYTCADPSAPPGPTEVLINVGMYTVAGDHLNWKCHAGAVTVVTTDGKIRWSTKDLPMFPQEGGGPTEGNLTASIACP